MSVNHGRSTRRWRKLRLIVLARDPYCTIRGPRCTGRSTTADHIIPKAIAPQLAEQITNLRGACLPCNAAGGARMTNQKRARPRPRPFKPREW